VLTRGVDPGERAREYIVVARELLAQARVELERGDLRQAGEKIWGTCALATKAHALAKRGRALESHRDLWLYKDEVAKEPGDWVRGAFLSADSMHKNFYEGLATREDVEDSLREVEKLVSAVSKCVEGWQTWVLPFTPTRVWGQCRQAGDRLVYYLRRRAQGQGGCL